MSQTSHHDLERGNDLIDSRPNQSQSEPNHVEADYGDSSWPLYTMYSKIAHEEDDRIAELREKSTDGILIFTGLFSATVAVLLAVTIPDLKPSSQDTSAFYLANIYELFANPNASDGSIPSTLPLPKPPALTPPKYIVWVNSLWLLALLISLTGALSATVQVRWSLRYLMITQSKDHPPDMRAKIHATMALSKNGHFFFRDSPLILLCLHASLFLFMAGVLIYFFEINNAVFYGLVWWIPIIIIPYAFLTVAPIFHHHMLWYTPLSPLVLYAYLGFPYALSQVCSWIKPLRSFSDYMKKHYDDLLGRYSEGFFEGKTKSAKKSASEPSKALRIDMEVLGRTLLVLDEDHTLEAFFDSIPGFCDSKLVRGSLPYQFTVHLKQSLDGFLDRTFSSHMVTEAARGNRLITCLNAAYSALGPNAVSQILGDFSNGRRGEALNSVEIGHCLNRWSHSSNGSIVSSVRRTIACIIARAQDRNDKWTMLIKEVFGVPDEVFQAYLPRKDSVLLTTLIHITREVLATGLPNRGVLESLSQFDIRNTDVELQHEFCALWNKVVQEARNEGAGSTATQILAGIYRLFNALHQGTNSVPVRYSHSDPIDDPEAIVNQPSCCPSCNDPSHRPHSSPPDLATTSPSSPPRVQLGDSLIASPRPALVSQPPLAAFTHLTTEHATPHNADISIISDIAGPIRDSRGGPARGQVEEARTNPPPVIVDPFPTPIPSPDLGSHIPAVYPSGMDSAVPQTHHVPNRPGTSSSTSFTGPWSVSSPHDATTTSGQYPGVDDGAAGSQDDTYDVHPPE